MMLKELLKLKDDLDSAIDLTKSEFGETSSIVGSLLLSYYEVSKKIDSFKPESVPEQKVYCVSLNDKRIGRSLIEC